MQQQGEEGDIEEGNGSRSISVSRRAGRGGHAHRPQVGEALVVERADGLGEVAVGRGRVPVQLSGGVVGQDPGEDGVLVD